jgi:hypothetical protein
MARPSAHASLSSSRLLAVSLLVLGSLLLLVSIFADQLQLSGGGDGLGWKQLLGAIVGLVLLLTGAAWLLQPGGGASDDTMEVVEE